MEKQSYLSPSLGLLELTIIRDAHPTVSILLDLGIPNFTVFSLKFPFIEEEPTSTSALVAESIHILLDEMSAFMLSMEFDNDVIVSMYSTILDCFKNMTAESDPNANNSPASQDASIKMFEGTFKLPMAFVNETYDKVVTAATKIQRTPAVRHLQLDYSKPIKPSVSDAQRIIRQYQHRSLKTQPQPLYVVVYDTKGRPRGTIPFDNTLKNKLLKSIYAAKTPEYTATVKFLTEMDMKLTNVDGIPKNLFVGEVQFDPEAYCGNDMALYRGGGGDTYIVKLPDGRCVGFPLKRPSILFLKANNFPVPGEYGRWRMIHEEEPEEQSEDAVDSVGKELNETDPEFDAGTEGSKTAASGYGFKRQSPENSYLPQLELMRMGKNVGVGDAVQASAKTGDYHDSQGFWAGEGGGASGILPICSKTKRICLAWRSSAVQQGDCWGTLGGAIQRGMEPAASAQEEMAEETGYRGAVQLHPAFVFKSGTFSYFNFIGIVPNEFGFHPHSGASWETYEIRWVSYEEVLEMMRMEPGLFHTGLIVLFKNSGELIRNLCAESSTNQKENSK
jgi:8-oxo-dGTP pyrophosphatase MutT (NUDIX family)